MTKEEANNILEKNGVRKRYRNRFRCPFCVKRVGYRKDDGSLSLFVKDKKIFVHCFRCKYTAVLNKLLQDLGKEAIKEEASYEYKTNYDSLSDYLKNILVGREDEEKGDEEQLEIVRLPDFCYVIMRDYSGFSRDFKLVKYRALDYLEKRGISGYLVSKYSFYFGLKGWMANRVVVPILNGGRLCGYVGRTFINDSPKYLNSKSRFSRLLFGIDDVEHFDYAIVVEGIFDKLRLESESDIGKQCVCSFGRKLSDEQMNRLADFGRVILAFDSDASSDIMKYYRKNPFKYTPVFVDEGDPGNNPGGYLEEIGKIL